MAKFKVGDIVTRNKEYLTMWMYGKRHLTVYKISHGRIFLEELPGHWSEERFDLIQIKKLKDYTETELIQTMGYRNG